MTLIAAFKAFEVPMLLGDILVSQMGDIQPHIKMPTLPQATMDELMPTEWMRSVTKLRRKVAVINSRLAIAWAGSSIGAKYVVKNLRNEFHSKSVNRQKLSQFFYSLETLGTEANCILVGWLIDKHEIVSFKWESQSDKLIFNGDPYLIGSGKDDFFNKHLARISDIQNEKVKTKVRYAIRDSLMIACELVGSELLFGDNLLQLYGGGFEVVYFEKGKFHQLNDVVFLFWTINKLDADSISFDLDPLIMEYRYINDNLVINSLRQKESTRPKILSYNSEFYVIPPVYSDEKNINFNVNRTDSISPKYYANFFFAEVSDKFHIRSSLIIDGKNDLIHLVRQNGVFGNLELTEKFAPLVHDFLSSVVQNQIYGMY